MSPKHNPFVAIATPADTAALLAWAATRNALALDLGAGDGRYASKLALNNPETAVIAIDTCADNARATLRCAPANLRFGVTDATALPSALLLTATEISINFPWGSLLRALLNDTHPFAEALRGRSVIVRVNGGALAEVGFTFDAGRDRLARVLGVNHFSPYVRELDRSQLQALPTTWSKRLAFGRDPRAIEIRTSLLG